MTILSVFLQKKGLGCLRVNQSGVERQVNISATKRKRKSVATDEGIALAIKEFSYRILEIEKAKLDLAERMLVSERELREMILKDERVSREMMRGERESREMMM